MYRNLKAGEIIQPGDEADCCTDPWRDAAKWVEVSPSIIGTAAPDPAYPAHTRYRRPIVERASSDAWLGDVAGTDKAEHPSSPWGPDHINTTSAPMPSGLFDKIRRMMFPARHCPPPELEGDFEVAVHVTAVTKFNWKDRLRVLVSGVVVTQVVYLTERQTGKAASSAVTHVGTHKDWQKG